MGSLAWRVGKRSFAMLYDYGKGLTVSFWVGIERQGPLEMDPRFSDSARIWATTAGSRSTLAKGVNERELREFLVESFRHFATRRALAKLDATTSRCLDRHAVALSAVSLNGVS